MIELDGKEKVQLHPNMVVSNPLVSVLVQTYNHENYIRKCLDGILMQEVDFEYEILISEDDSIDETRKICVEYAFEYPDKIRLFLHDRLNNIEINGNPTGRYCFIWNTQHSNGKYIAMCDGDDYWDDPNKLQQQVDFMESNLAYSTSFHNATVIDENENIILESLLKSIPEKGYTIEEMLRGKVMPTSTILFRNCIKEIPYILKKILNADTFLFALLAHHGPAKYMHEIKNVKRRIHSGGIWSSLSEYNKLKSGTKSYLEILDEVDFKYKKIVAAVVVEKLDKLIHIHKKNKEFKLFLRDTIKRHQIKIIYKL